MELPPQLLQYAGHLWRRFPEVFLALGSPDFEEHFEAHEGGSWYQRIIDTECAKVIEIRLPRRSACWKQLDSQDVHRRQPKKELERAGSWVAADGAKQYADELHRQVVESEEADVAIQFAKQRRQCGSDVRSKATSPGASEAKSVLSFGVGTSSSESVLSPGVHNSTSTTATGASSNEETPFSAAASSQQRCGNHAQQQPQPPPPPTGPAKPLVSTLAVRRGIVVFNVRTKGLGSQTHPNVIRLPELDRLAGYPIRQLRSAGTANANPSVSDTSQQLKPRSEMDRLTGSHDSQPSVAESMDSHGAVSDTCQQVAPQQAAEPNKSQVQLHIDSQEPTQGPWFSKAATTRGGGFVDSLASSAAPAAKQNATPVSMSGDGCTVAPPAIQEPGADSPGARIQWFAQRRRHCGTIGRQLRVE